MKNMKNTNTQLETDAVKRRCNIEKDRAADVITGLVVWTLEANMNIVVLGEVVTHYSCLNQVPRAQALNDSRLGKIWIPAKIFLNFGSFVPSYMTALPTAKATASTNLVSVEFTVFGKVQG